MMVGPWSHQIRPSVSALLVDEAHAALQVAKVMGHPGPSVTLGSDAHPFDRSEWEPAKVRVDAGKEITPLIQEWMAVAVPQPTT